MKGFASLEIKTIHFLKCQDRQMIRELALLLLVLNVPWNIFWLLYAKTDCFAENDEDKCRCVGQTKWSLFIVSASACACYFFMNVWSHFLIKIWISIIKLEIKNRDLCRCCEYFPFWNKFLGIYGISYLWVFCLCSSHDRSSPVWWSRSKFLSLCIELFNLANWEQPERFLGWWRKCSSPRWSRPSCRPRWRVPSK